MEFLFLTGSTGQILNVDENGRLLVTDSPIASGLVLTYGSTGRAVAVDGNGRLHVSHIPGSGISLPAASGATFGSSFYVIGSGFYLKGLNDWEQVTSA